jgi:HD-GYP domain-containing protein (c-di-GMP phosphodiesterase class II)
MQTLYTVDATELDKVVEKAVIKALDQFTVRHPVPTQVNRTQAGEMLGFSPPTIRDLISAGTLRLNDCGLIPIEQVWAARSAR